MVTLAMAFAIMVLSVLVAGGDLRRIGTIRFRWAPVVALALAVQVLIEGVVNMPHGVNVAVHIASYVIVSVFLVANWRVPGMKLIALGAILNFVVISTNGGVMPANRHAVHVAGRDHKYAPAFENSQPIAHPRLSFLGDVFPIPKSWPLPVHNVFSVGDILIVVGAGVGLHEVCESRLTRGGRRRRSVPHSVES
jgi:hypothetical protein